MTCPSCNSCNSPNTKANGHSASGVQRYICKDCRRSFSDGDRHPGRPKRADGLTKQQAWYRANKDRAAQAQRERRAKKKNQIGLSTMNDQYTESLSRDEAQRVAYWECVDEAREDEELEELVDEPLSAETLQWIFDKF